MPWTARNVYIYNLRSLIQHFSNYALMAKLRLQLFVHHFLYSRVKAWYTASHLSQISTTRFCCETNKVIAVVRPGDVLKHRNAAGEKAAESKLKLESTKQLRCSRVRLTHDAMCARKHPHGEFSSLSRFAWNGIAL